MPAIDWQPWHTAAFLDAQRRRRPVLLLLEVAWAPACAEAHAQVFARPDVATAIHETAVPVRVDADLRPDIADRYGLGHWPSLLLLTPEGHVLTGGTRLDAGLAARLRAAAVAAATTPAPPRAHAIAVDVLELSDEVWTERVADAVWACREPETGAFRLDGVAGATATLAALARAAVRDDAAWAETAARTLDGLERAADDPTMLSGPQPGAPVRLDVVAEWTRTLARAVTVEPDALWQRLLGTFVDRLVTFRRADGQWRPWTGAVEVVLVDSAARACRALLAAAGALDRPALAADAIAALEVLAPAAYVRSSGVAHVLQHGQARGPVLLDDAMHLAHALLDGEAWRGDGVYRDLADELRQTTRARLQDATGALQDRRATLAGAGQVGRLADSVHPLVGNALATTLERRLATALEAPDTMRRGLRAVSADAALAGGFAAPVLLAWDAVGAGGDVVAAW